MARNVYKACMDLDKIEEVGLDPLKTMLKQMGGWPVLEGQTWNEDSFRKGLNLHFNPSINPSRR